MESMGQRFSCYNPTVVEERRAHRGAARAIARLFTLFDMEKEQALREAARLFFLEPADLEVCEVDPMPLIREGALHDPILATEVVKVLLDHGVGREVAVAGTAGYFHMKVDGLVEFWSWLEEDAPGDFELLIPISDREEAALLRAALEKK